MNYDSFYSALFQPVDDSFGPRDPDTIVALIGFDLGGPLNLCTWGGATGDQTTTYVSCELAVRDDQITGELGPYELMVTCDEETWVRSVLSDIGRMSLEARFYHHHTLDIGP
jgi:hypothetical protein